MNSSVSQHRPPVSEAMISFEQELQGAEGSRAGGSGPPIERTTDPCWLLVEGGFQPAREHEIESLLAISNGYSGTRGSLAELSALSSPATFVAGVFQQLDIPESIPELMVLPDWTALKIWIDHQPLSLEEGEVLEHRRILDLRRGMLWREWRHRDPSGRITRIVGFRLASLSDRHLLVQSVALTAENYSATVEFESAIEVDPSAASLLAPDWIARSSSAPPSVLPLALRAPGRETTIIFGFTSQMLNSTGLAGVRKVATEERRIIERCDLDAEVGTEYQLHRFISLCTSRESPKPFECVIERLQRVLTEGVSVASFAHASEWESRWQAADVEIEGDEFLQQAVRFAGYHLIGASNPNDGRVSIGARGLTGRAYLGHVFWDTEIYMLPFFIFSHPASARSLLEYRYHTLNAAREKARDFGFRGAMYPWESADTGEDVTPQALIIPTGEVIRVRNAEMEIHITADIAFAGMAVLESNRRRRFPSAIRRRDPAGKRPLLGKPGHSGGGWRLPHSSRDRP
jgi:trehalose/maltose hydrolase-like predicted phosphorylase